MNSAAESPAGKVLIVAPTGRDAALAAATLQRAGISSAISPAVRDVVQQLDDTTGAVLLAEEALTPGEMPALLDWFSRQPPWSDLPLLLLMTNAASEEASTRVLQLFSTRANISLLERPLGTVTLVSAVQTALRARQRQHEVRDLLVQRGTILASIGDAFSALDHDWRYTYVNDKAAEYAGMSKEEMIGRTVWEIYPESIGSVFEERARRALERRRPEQFERFNERPRLWLETRIYPAPDGIVVLRADITERKNHEALMAESERKLKESDDRLRLATDAAAIGTFDYYPETGELELSERGKEVVGQPKDAPVSYASYRAAFHPDDRQVADDIVERLRTPGGDDHYAIEYRTIGVEDGREHWVAERGRVVRDADGRPVRYVGTLLDITEAKTAALALQRAKAAAEEANRTKDQFLAMLSHELRTPLTPVLMTLAALRRDSDLSDALRRDLDMLQRNVELEALLIDDLLDLTRITHGKLELHHDAVDIHVALEHALNISASELHDKKLTVARFFEAPEHHCWADGARLQQVFWNLVKNAVKFTPAGGRVEIRTRNDAAHNIWIEISDNGIGIDPALLPRVFDAFEQGGRTMTSQYGGLGLGLAISKRVIDLHGGTITATSPGPGQGATFVIQLKAMETSLLEGPAVYLPNDIPSRLAAAILLVEDHADTARVLRRILEHAGYAVTHADTVSAARTLAAGQHFDLVVSDVGLPDGSGLDLMRSLRAAHGLNGIALSGFGTDEDLAASSAAGFAEHLTKPVDWPQLSDAIERLLGTKAQSPAQRAASS